MSSKQFFSEFITWVESTDIPFQNDILGFPWYPVTREAILNGMLAGDSKTPVAGEGFAEKRHADFLSKTHLLEQKYDYVFFSKPKMRGVAGDNCENRYFLELIERLQKRGKEILILEMYAGDALYDLQYLESKYSERTLPYEYVSQYLAPALAPDIQIHKQQYDQLLTTMFHDKVAPNEFQELYEEFKNTYRGLAGLIDHIVLLQALVAKFEASAFVGGMGTHLWTGFNNKHYAIEISHGYIGARHTEVHFSEPVMQHLAKSFDLEKYCLLVPSHTTELATQEPLCLEENRYNFGALEIRGYKPKEEDILALRSKYNPNSNPVVLLCTSSWVTTELVESFVYKLRAQSPKLVLLLRPHPAYDDPNRFSKFSPEFSLVYTEAKYDLFQLADVVVSNPSSMLVEASFFTDNIIVFPDRGISDQEHNKLDVTKEKYPFAQVGRIEEPEKLVQMIQHELSHPRRKDIHSSFPIDFVDNELEKLYAKVER